jgi:hypothetical protein
MFSPTPTTGNNSGRTTPSVSGSNGRNTPTSATSNSSYSANGIDVALSVDDSSFQVVSSDQLPKKYGREKGAAAYSASEHLALLSIIADEKNSFNVSEGSTQWATVYKRMIAEYYTPLGVTPRQSTALQTHFIELYSAFKQGIRNLSLEGSSLRCPTVYVKGDDAVDNYLESLHKILTSDGKKYHPKKWWSETVVEMLLQLHLEYTAEFGAGQQNPDWIKGKAVAHKNKFETDQKNREAEMARKRAAEEEERKEAAKNRKIVAESSQLLVATLEKLVTPAPTHDIGVIVQEKMAVMKNDMMEKIEEKLDNKFSSFLANMQQMLERRNG